MKKDYSKPAITFESFKLSTSIAGNCSQQPNLEASLGFNIFVTGCEYTPQDGEFGFCYHNPDDDHRVFAS